MTARQRKMIHTFPAEYLEQIGSVVVSFNRLEDVVSNLVGSLIDEHQAIGQIITAELSFRATRDLVTSLYFERHGEGKDFSALKRLLKECSAIEQDRNLVMHSTWLAGEDSTEIIRHKRTAKGSLKFQFDPTSVEGLRSLSKRIKHLITGVRAFQLKLIRDGKLKNNPIEKTW